MCVVPDGAACRVRERRDARACAPHAASTRDRARGPPHPFLGRRVGAVRARNGGAPRRRHGARARPQRALPPLRLPRLFRAPLEPGHQDVRARDHGASQEVRREHPRCRLPPAPAVHSERGRRRTRQGVCVNAPRLSNEYSIVSARAAPISHLCIDV